MTSSFQPSARGLFVLLAISSCCKSSLVPEGAEAGADTTAPVSSEISHRDCTRTSLGGEWTLTPRVECRSEADCTEKPHGSCIGIPLARCEYSTGPGQTSDSCQRDADCIAASGGHCPKWASTFCVYERCSIDAECGPGAVCLCSDGSGGDHYCVTDGCRVNGDCSPGQKCQQDESIQGAPPQWHCTKPSDACHARSDCPNSEDYCGYDLEMQDWVCRPLTTVD